VDECKIGNQSTKCNLITYGSSEFVCAGKILDREPKAWN